MLPEAMVTKVASCVIFRGAVYRPERFTGALMPNITVRSAYLQDVSCYGFGFASFFKRRR